jgi:hypothetical protein
VDNKKEQVKDQEFFNNELWKLEELFDRERAGFAAAHIIDPCSPPNTQWTGYLLRSTFNSFNSMYTAVYFKFKSSGNNEGGGNPEFEEQCHC